MEMRKRGSNKEGLGEGRKAYKEARGVKSDGEARAHKATEAPKLSVEKRKDMGKMGGKGEMTGTARKVEVHHYHHRAEKKA